MSVPDHPFDELALFLRWKRLRETGQPADPEELCRHRPDLLPRLREMIRAYETGTSDATLTAPPPTPTASFPGSGGSVAEELPSIPGYQVVGKLGIGGMGLVFEARDRLDRHVALKVVGPGVFYAPQLAERLQREARAMAQLQHDRIATVYESGEWGGWPFYTMPLFRGGTLGERLAEFRADPKRAVELMAQVVEAVAYLHGKGYLHRDLKPSNILLDEEGRPHVADFGLVKLLDEEVQLTATGAGMGTPQYMAPEQLPASRERVGAAADVWALGIILFELLAGKRPFDDKERSEIYRQILHDPVPSPRSENPALDPGLERIIRNCLAKRPEERYASASQLAEDLRAWLAGQRVPDRRPRPRRWPRWVAALLAVAGVMSTATLFRTPPDPEAAARTAMEAIHQRLAEKQAVDLVGPTGGPAASRWLLNAGAETHADPRDGTFTLSSPRRLSLLTLVGNPQVKRYRFQVDVRHNQAPPNGGDAGLFFAGGQNPAVHGTERWFCSLSFADRGPLAEGFFAEGVRPDAEGSLPEPEFARVAFCCSQVYEPSGRAGADRHFVPPGMVHLFHSAQRQGLSESPWRRLAVEVSPTALRFFWEDSPKPFAEIERGRLTGLTHHIDFEFVPYGSLGLYVNAGEASFRNAVVRPLDD